MSAFARLELLVVAALVAIAAAAASLSMPAPAPAASTACAAAHVVPNPDRVGEVANATLCLLNRERARRNLRPLRRNRSLDRVASRYARQMVQARFFAHVSPSGTTLVSRVRGTSYLDGVRSWRIGENIAWGTGGYASAAETVQSWMDSPGHRRNILDRRFREIGIGVALGVPVRLEDGLGGATYAHVFGRRVR